MTVKSFLYKKIERLMNTKKVLTKRAKHTKVSVGFNA